MIRTMQASRTLIEQPQLEEPVSDLTTVKRLLQSLREERHQLISAIQEIDQAFEEARNKL